MSRNVSVHSESLKYPQKICVGSHVFHSDEPIDLGGNDAGPNPDELLMTALGACANITARMYAERKRWPLHEAEATLQYERVHADGNAQPGAKYTAVDQIEMVISFCWRSVGGTKTKTIGDSQQMPDSSHASFTGSDTLEAVLGAQFRGHRSSGGPSIKN
jgi:uncharacterized OsmC-like protein